MPVPTFCGIQLDFAFVNSVVSISTITIDLTYILDTMLIIDSFKAAPISPQKVT